MNALTRPPDTPISAQAGGQLRLLRGTLQARADALQTAADAAPRQLLREVRHCTATKRDASMRRILLAMPEAPLHREKRGALWRLLSPDNDMVIVEALAFGALGSGGWTRQEFGLGFTPHALGRLLDRSGFTANPTHAMLQAHDALLALRPDEGNRLFNLETLSLPAEGGIFLVHPHVTNFPFAVAKTWVAADQFRGQQEADATAWRSLLSLESSTTAKT